MRLALLSDFDNVLIFLARLGVSSAVEGELPRVVGDLKGLALFPQLLSELLEEHVRAEAGEEGVCSILRWAHLLELKMDDLLLGSSHGLLTVT